MKSPGWRKASASSHSRIFGICIALLFLFFSAAEAQVAKKLQILLPGMTPAPNTGNGYNGSPIDQTSGVPFDVIVNAVDNNWNIVPVNDQVSLTSSDQLAELPLPVNLVNGSTTLSVILNSNGLYSITAHDDSKPSVNSASSPPVRIVKIDYFMIIPIGNPVGGVPGQVSVGETIPSVEISARDQNGNLVNKYNGRVYLSELTDYGEGRIEPEAVQLSSGKWIGDLKIYRAGEKEAAWGVTGDVWLKASDGTPASDKMEIIITADDAYELYVNGNFIGGNAQPTTAQTYILPYRDGKNVVAIHGTNQSSSKGLLAEIRVNGQIVKVSGNTWLQTSTFENGWQSFDFNDQNWSQSTDLGAYGIPPWGTNVAGFPAGSPAHWIWGNADETYFRTTVTVNSVPPAPAFTPHDGESNRFCALPGSFSQLLTILPGESFAPGSRIGKTGLPNDQPAGNDFWVNVYGTDNFWNKIPNTDVVALTSSDAAANLPFNATMNNGSVSMNVTLNSAGMQTVSARDVSNASVLPDTSSEVRVVEGIDHFVFSNISATQVAGQPFNVTITAVNDLGVPATNFQGMLTISSTTGEQTVFPSEITMINGTWSGSVMLTKAATLVNLAVTDAANPPHTGNSNQFNVVAGTAAKLQVLVPGETATPGIAPGKTGTAAEVLAGSSFYIRVNAVDQWWNVINSNADLVHLSSSDAAASLPNDASLSGGTKQFLVTLNTNGLQTVSASDVTNPVVAQGTGSQIRVNPGNMDHFEFTTIVGPKFAGTPFSITITAADPQGNPVTDYSGVVFLAASTGDNTMIPITANFNNGTWTGNVTLKVASGGVYLTAKDGATPPHTGTSNQFEVQPGTLTKFQVLVPGMTATPGVEPGHTGSPQSQNAGHPFPIVVNGVDEYWNVVTTASDSFGVSSTDAFASLPEPAQLINGAKNVSITLNSDGAHTVSAFHLNNPTIQNGQTPQISVLPQNLDHFEFSTISSPVTAGTPFSVAIEAQTADNQTVFGFNGTVELSASTGTGTITPVTVGPFQNGVFSGEITLTKAAGSVTLTANDNGTPNHTGTSNAFTVVPGSFSKLQVLLPGEQANPGVAPGKTGTPLDQQTGEEFNVSVRAVDNHWNLITAAGDSIELSSTDTSAIFSETGKLINGAASQSFIMGTAGIHTVSAADISSPSILGSVSSAINIFPGNLDHFEFATIANQTAGNAFGVTITATDVAGNPVSGYNGHARLESSSGAATISPSEVDFVDGVWSGNITITKATANVQLTCLDFAANPHSGQSNLFNITPGEFTRMQILLPGETATPGIAPGKTGDVDPLVAGDAIPVTINAVDEWWNAVTTDTGTVGLSATDPSANLPLDAQLQSGTITFANTRLNTPGFWTLTAHYRHDPQISSDTSPLIHVVSGSVASFLFEPISSPQSAGGAINVTIHAVNGSGSTVTNYNEMVSLTSSTGPGTIIVGNVQFVDGTWSGPVTITKAAQSVHLNAHDFADIVRGNSNPFTVVPGAFSKLQLLMPGELETPGLAPGKSGNPQPQISGVPFQIKLRTTDAWWNVTAPDSFAVNFSATDPQAVLPSETMLTAGISNIDFTMLTPGNQKLRVAGASNPAFADTSSQFSVQSGAVHHFAFSVIDSGQIAGQPFSLHIQAMNIYDNPITDYDGDIILSASTGNGTITQTGVTLANGNWQGELAVTRADSAVVLYAADYVPAPNTHTGYSNTFTVVPAELAGLQVLLPGETVTPGVNPGKKGNALTQTAGNAFNITVRAVDAFWNIIAENADSLSISVSDTFAQIPADIQLANGRSEIPVTVRAAGTHNIQAQFTFTTGFPAAIADSLIVEPNAFSQLLVLLPGESLLPGDTENDPLKTPGRANSAQRQTSGLPFSVEVWAVDDYWNAITNAPADNVHLFTTDNSATIIKNDSVLVNGKAGFSVTLNQGGNQIVRAINDSRSSIRTSLDALLEVLVGGLHYEISLDTTRFAAGESFAMTVFFKNGIGEIVPSANHVVNLSAVDAQDIDEVVGTFENASFNLQGGQRTVQQSGDFVGVIRIKVADGIGTDPGYSDPLEIFAGNVASISVNAPKTELRGLEELVLLAKLFDQAGNPVINHDVSFELVQGSGQLKQGNAVSNGEGVASVTFAAGRVTETNFVRAFVDTVATDFEIVVNLTTSDMPDGQPVNYPNPFGLESDMTRIDYYLPVDADVKLQIFDLFGNLVWTQKISAGEPGGKGRENSSHPNSVIWNGVNDRGQKVGNGGYILVAKATANGKVVMNAMRKIAVLR